MSCVETILALGIILSIIAIVDGTKQVCDAATDIEGLLESFRKVRDRQPIVANILGFAKLYIDSGNADKRLCEAIKAVVEACERKAKILDNLFRNTEYNLYKTRGNISVCITFFGLLKVKVSSDFLDTAGGSLRRD
jgi:hypothetical protein